MPVPLWEFQFDAGMASIEPGSLVLGTGNEAYLLQNAGPTGYLTALSANGRVRWRGTIPQGAPAGSGIALTQSGQLYCNHFYTQSSWTTAGTLLWSIYLGCYQMYTPIVDSGGIMYGSAAVRQPDGQLVGVGGPWGPVLPPGGGANGVLFNAGDGWNGTTLSALHQVQQPDRTWVWQTIWSRSDGGGFMNIGPDGTLFVLLNYGQLRALDPDGNTLWTVSGAGSAPAVAADGTLRVRASGLVGLRCFRADGSENWTLPLTYTGVGQPIVDALGNTYAPAEYLSMGTYSPAVIGASSDGRLLWEVKLLGNVGDPRVILGEKQRVYLVNGRRVLALGVRATQADLDADSDVDPDDLDLLTTCWTGPSITYSGGGLPADCNLIPDGQGIIAADLDRDGDVDQSDFGLFQRCLSSPDVAADPNCAN